MQARPKLYDWFQPVPEHKAGKNRLHLDVYVTGRDDAGAFAPGGDLADSQLYYADVKSRAAALGRDPEHIVILNSATPIVARSSR